MRYEKAIKRALVITMDSNFRILYGGYIGIEDKRIAYVGREEIRGEEEIDAEGKAVIPGLINCHTHSPMTLFRGLIEDVPLNIWLEKVAWPLESRLKQDHVYAGALLACYEMLSNGITLFADHYFMMGSVVKAVEETGIKAVLAEAMIEAINQDNPEKLLNEGVEFCRKFQGYADGRIRTMLGPHAEYSCSIEFLSRVAEEARRINAGIHMHLAEDRNRVGEFISKYGVSPVKKLYEIDFLSDKLLIAHAIHLSEEDIELLHRRGVGIAYCPTANMKVALGIPLIHKMLGKNMKIGLGTDGPASNNSLDIVREMKQAALLQKIHTGDPSSISAKQALYIATKGGAEALGMEHEVGSIEVGKRADLTLIDLNKPHLKPLHEIYAALVYAATGRDVELVMIDGEVVMENGQLRKVHLEKVVNIVEKSLEELGVKENEHSRSR